MIARRRTALCLYGRFNNRLSDRAGVEGAAYIYEQIINGRDVDVFIFSHDLANESTIRALYGPFIREAVFEELPDFSPLIDASGIDESVFVPMEGFRTVANSLAFFYARSRSLGLMRKRLEQGDHYDAAICSRFDLGQLDKVGRRMRPFAVSQINFNENRDMSRFYSAMWNQLNMGYGDQWFYSAPHQLAKLELMYERTFDYLRLGSDYLKWLSTGITDSKSGDELSNEMLKPPEERSSSMDTMPIGNAVHNHLLHKYFALEQGLYDRSTFVSDFTNTAHVLYTHTSYADVWPMYFGQQQRYFHGFARNYVLVDQYSPGIPPDYVQIIYDDSLSYVDRLLQGLSLVPEGTVFFDHEDMVLNGAPNIPALRRAWSRVRPGSCVNPTRLDFVRLIRSGLDSTVPDPRDRDLHYLLPWSRWHFSIQPSFWLKHSLVLLLETHRGQSLWEFENSAQKTVRRKMIRGATLWAEGEKRGTYAWDNPIYPYIATAVSKGKWTTSEFGNVLTELLNNYDIDPNLRGEIQAIDQGGESAIDD
jgi:hypothetical protein